MAVRKWVTALSTMENNEMFIFDDQVFHPFNNLNNLFVLQNINPCIIAWHILTTA